MICAAVIDAAPLLSANHAPAPSRVDSSRGTPPDASATCRNAALSNCAGTRPVEANHCATYSRAASCPSGASDKFIVFAPARCASVPRPANTTTPAELSTRCRNLACGKRSASSTNSVSPRAGGAGSASACLTRTVRPAARKTRATSSSMTVFPVPAAPVINRHLVPPNSAAATRSRTVTHASNGMIANG